MKKNITISGLALTPKLAFAHDGVDPASFLHNFAHFSESYGLLVAIPVALAVFIGLKRRRAAIKSATTK